MRDPVQLFTQALAADGGPGPFAALDALCQSLVGHRLFSCSRFDLDSGSGTAARVYTSDEASYPTSGLKEIVPNRWTETVLDRHETFVANSVEGFADVFPDHAFIASLGLGSVVNLPVILRGKMLGTVNILHVAGHFDAARLERLGPIGPAALLAFVLDRQAASI